MKAGVSTVPWARWSVPRRARPSVWCSSNFIGPSFDQHGIPVTEKPVPLRHRVAVGTPNVVQATESRYQHQQGGARQVKVGEQALHHLEVVARENEDIGFTVTRLQLAPRRSRLQ